MKDIIIQIITAAIGSFGFSIIYNIRGMKLFAASAGGALSWAVYLLMGNMGMSYSGAIFIATMSAGFLSEILARIMKTPVTILFVPMLIPLVPGRLLFYMTSNFMVEDYVVAGEYGQRLLFEAGAIALGIIMVSCVTSLVFKIYRTFV